MKKNTIIMLQLGLFILFVFSQNFNVLAEGNVNDMFPTEEPESTAEDNKEETNDITVPNEIKDNNDSIFTDLIKMVLMLVIVIGLIYFLLKFLQKRNKMFQQVKSLQNLGGISLGNNKSIQMVRIGQKVFVLGIGDNINLLTEIEDESMIQELLKDDVNEAKGPQSLQTLIQQFRGLKEQKNSETKTFQSVFKNELETIKSNRNKIIQNTNDRNEDQDE